MAALTDLTAPSTKTKVRVSSVLNRNVKEFGAAHLFDGSPDTCWNSGQGSPQWVWLQFQRPVHVHTFQIMFQGGFAAEEMQVSVTFHTPPPPPRPPPPPSSDSPSVPSQDATAVPTKKKAAPVLVANIFLNDDNSLQSFDLPQSIAVVTAAAAAAAAAIGEGGQAAVEAAAPAAAAPPPPMVTDMRLTFMSSFDFYGRVTAYQLKVLGQEQGEEEGR